MANDDVRVVMYGTREQAGITVKFLEAPYGEDSEAVVSIGCSLKGDWENPSWKVHVPARLIPQVINAVMDVVPDSDTTPTHDWIG